MIANYPRFSKLQLLHRQDMVKVTSRFDPYSDFNFTSLFCWNTDGQTEVSLLNGNIVVKLADYITGEPVFSILGTTNLEESIDRLLMATHTLNLVPEVVINSIAHIDKYHVAEDRDNFDYVYSLEEQTSLDGGENRNRRKRIGRFRRENPSLVLSEIDFSDLSKHEALREVFLRWALIRNRSHSEVLMESKAIDNCLRSYKRLDLICLEILLDGQIVGFSLNEKINNEYAVCHFQKSILSFDSIDAVLTHYAAQKLIEHGCKLVNWEQDLGIPGLRAFKESYGPTKYLKKYTLSRPTGS